MTTPRQQLLSKDQSAETGAARPSWLIWVAPWILSLSVFVLITALLWRVDSHHQSKRAQDERLAAETARESINARLRSDEEFLKLLVQNAQEGMLTEPLFTAAASAYVAEHPQLTAIYVADRMHAARWVAPPDPQADTEELLRYLPEHQKAFDDALNSGRLTYSATHVGLAGHQCFDAYVPISRGSLAPGAVVAAYQTRSLLRSALDRSILQSHQFELIDAGGAIIHKTPAVDTLDPAMTQTVLLERPSNGMSLRMIPYQTNFWDWQMLLLTSTALALALGTSVGVWMLQRQVQQTRRAEAALQTANAALESRVEERTHELIESNRLLTREMSEREAAEATARRMLDQLAQIGRVSLVGEMAAGLAHELNQPLGAINTYVRGGKRVLNQTEHDSARIWQALDGIDQQNARAVAIINRLRAFVSSSPLNTHDVNFHELCRESIELIEPQRRAFRIDVSNCIPHDAPHVRIDRIQIQQVLLNLVMNAFESIEQASASERRVTIALGDKVGGYIEIHVTDTGGGISPDVAPRLFDPFVTTKRKGMGMGLAISRTIMEAHGGRLFATAGAQGETVFSFTIPLAEVHDVHHTHGSQVTAQA